LLAKAFAAATPADARKILRAGLKDESQKKRQDRQDKRLTKMLAEAEGQTLLPQGIDLRHCSVRELLETWTGAADLVHADPAWQYDNQNQNGTTDKHYDSNTMADITVMLDKAYDKARNDTYMLLWVPIPLLKEWFDASAGDELRWQYKSGGVWGKTGRKGIGFHWRGDAEMLLLYVKGKPQPLDNNTSNLHISARTEHSEKPEDWLQILVSTFCSETGTVMDLWAGLGSMARACSKQVRGYVGAELDTARHTEALLMLAKQEN
jgi:site-specific DNA-methyltransferase (adenine-specific)